MWGHDPSRNMVSSETNLPDSVDAGKLKRGSEEIDLATTRNVKWVAKLGSQAFGNPVVAGGKVYVGTNNESPRDPRNIGDRGVLFCLDEKTGQFLWQLAVPKLGAGKVSDWEFLGLCSSPAVEGDRLYAVTNRCEVVCLTTSGLGAGNVGPFTDELKYMTQTWPKDKPTPTPGATDADIVWRFDMRDELGVFPHNITSSSVLLLGDRVYAVTSNGQDWSHLNIPSPNAPVLCVLDKKTGQLVGEEASGVSQRLFHCTWASPAYGKVGDRGVLIYGGGDGFLYGFDPVPVKNAEGVNVLKELFRYDCNPESHKLKTGNRYKYPDPGGVSEVIATPVFYQGRVYASVGQDPEHGEGVGCLHCVDASKTGDITTSGKVWAYDKIGRTLSTVAIADGLLYVGEYGGKVHCLDAQTGQVYWVHDAKSHIWGSTLVADGKVYFGNEDGDLTILATGKALKVIGKFSFNAPIYSTPIAANGVLYVATQTHLYAIQKK